jgi:hypothetical protein
MCPFCVSTLGVIVASAVPTGGLATLAVKMSRKKTGSTESISKTHEDERSSQDVD